MLEPARQAGRMPSPTLPVMAVAGTVGLGAAVVVNELVVLALVAVIVASWLAALGKLGPTLVFCMVLTSCASGVAIGPTLTLPDLFLLPASVLALWNVIVRRRPVAVPSWLTVPVVGILTWGLIAGLILAAPSYRYLFQFVGFMGLVPLTVAFYATTPRRLQVLSATYLASATINATLAVLDSSGVWHVASNITGARGLEFSGRVAGLSNHSNQLGLMCVMAIPISLYFSSRWRPAFVTTVVLVLGVASSGSRGALLGLPLCIILYILAVRKRVLVRLLWSAVGLAVGLLFAVTLGLSVGLVRLFAENGDQTGTASDATRFDLLADAFDVFLDHSFTGVGFALPHAHNVYVELARQGGIFTALLFIFFAAGAISTGFVLSRRIPIVVGVWAAQTSWLLLAVQHNALYERFLYIPTGLIVGGSMMLAHAGLNEDPERESVLV